MLTAAALLLLGGCGPVAPTEPPPAEPAGEPQSGLAEPAGSETAGYPAPQQDTSAYPAPEEPAAAADEQGYPAADGPPIRTDGVRFAINPALQPGDTVVTGTAPPDLTIAVVDVTLAGNVLGIGRSDESGNFSIPVPPLEQDRRIGLALGDLEEGTTFEEVTEQLLPFRGEGFMQVPNIGVYFDTLMIGEQ